MRNNNLFKKEVLKCLLQVYHKVEVDNLMQYQ